jgi:hypothetical protein
MFTSFRLRYCRKNLRHSLSNFRKNLVASDKNQRVLRNFMIHPLDWHASDRFDEWFRWATNRSERRAGSPGNNIGHNLSSPPRIPLTQRYEHYIMTGYTNGVEQFRNMVLEIPDRYGGVPLWWKVALIIMIL